MKDRPVDIRAINRESAEMRKAALMASMQAFIQQLDIATTQQDELLREFDRAINDVDTLTVFRDLAQLPSQVDVSMSGNPLLHSVGAMQHRNTESFNRMASILENLKAIVAVQSDLDIVDSYNQLIEKFNRVAMVNNHPEVAELKKDDALIYHFNQVCEAFCRDKGFDFPESARVGFAKFVRREELTQKDSEELNDFIDNYHFVVGKKSSQITPIVLKFQKFKMQVIAQQLAGKLSNQEEIRMDQVFIPPFKFNPRSSDAPQRQSQMDQIQAEKRQRKMYKSNIMMKMADRNIPFLLSNARNPHEFVLYQLDADGRLQTDRFTFEGKLGKGMSADAKSFTEVSAAIVANHANYQRMRKLAEKIWLDINDAPMPADQWQEIVIAINQNSRTYIENKLKSQPFVITPAAENTFNLHYLDKQGFYQVAKIAENSQEYKNIQVIASKDGAEQSYRAMLPALSMQHDLKQPVLSRWQQYKANVKSAWENFKKVSRERPFRMAVTIGLVVIGIAAAVTAIVFSAGIASVPVAVGVTAGLGALAASGGVALGVGGAILGLALAVGAVGVEWRRRKSEDAVNGVIGALNKGNGGAEVTVNKTVHQSLGVTPASVQSGGMEPVVEAKAVAQPRYEPATVEQVPASPAFRK